MLLTMAKHQPFFFRRKPHFFANFQRGSSMIDSDDKKIHYCTKKSIKIMETREIEIADGQRKECNHKSYNCQHHKPSSPQSIVPFR